MLDANATLDADKEFQEMISAAASLIYTAVTQLSRLTSVPLADELILCLDAQASLQQ
jgi:hypothetical protein